jgi:hypothetical protein
MMIDKKAQDLGDDILTVLGSANEESRCSKRRPHLCSAFDALVALLVERQGVLNVENLGFPLQRSGDNILYSHTLYEAIVSVFSKREPNFSAAGVRNAVSDLRRYLRDLNEQYILYSNHYVEFGYNRPVFEISVYSTHLTENYNDPMAGRTPIAIRYDEYNSLVGWQTVEERLRTAHSLELNSDTLTGLPCQRLAQLMSLAAQDNLSLGEGPELVRLLTHAQD